MILTLKPQLPPTIQAQLGLRDERYRPLSDIQTVPRDLGEFDIDADAIYNLCELRVLIGFNIATDGAEGKRREVRVLTKSIVHFRQGANRQRVQYHDLEWPKIFRQIIPHQKPIVTGLEFRRAMICDRGHIENLHLAGHLVALKKSQPGPGGTWTFSRDSVEAFLKGRQL